MCSAARGEAVKKEGKGRKMAENEVTEVEVTKVERKRKKICSKKEISVITDSVHTNRETIQSKLTNSVTN